MAVQSNPSDRHQQGVGRLIKYMVEKEYIVLQAQYGTYATPSIINGRKPDVMAYSTKVKGEQVIGEVEFASDLSEEDTRKQLRDLAEWAKCQVPPVRLILGVISQPNPERSMRDQLPYLADGWEIQNV